MADLRLYLLSSWEKCPGRTIVSSNLGIWSIYILPYLRTNFLSAPSGSNKNGLMALNLDATNQLYDISPR